MGTRRVTVFVTVLLFGGCVRSTTQECDWGLICPPGMTCDATRRECIFPSQRTSCLGKADGESCTFANAPEGSFYCSLSVCMPVQCGDEVTHEDPTIEACDDGNTVSGDDCSADCQSDETCPNGYVDSVAAEQCDDGNNVDNDGCTGTCVREYPVWRPVASPVTARFGGQASYDSHHERVLLFGGTATAVPPVMLDDTWTFDGVNWRPVTTNDATPPPRMDHGQTYDASRQQLVIFGGGDEQGEVHDDTWVFDGNNWTRIDSPLVPSARSSPVMAFHGLRGRTVLFGGETNDRSDLNDTWEFDGSQWTTMVTPDAPDPRRYSSMTWDPGRRRIVLFGGATDYDPGDLYWDYFADTWEFDGTQWHPLSTSTAPPARAGHQLVHDAGTGHLVLYGGWNNSGPMRDTWILNGQQWELRTAWRSPEPRIQFAMAHHAALGRTVLFGGTSDGSTALGDTWLYDPPWWNRSYEAPPRRAAYAMVYDSHRQRLVLFGGVYHSDQSIWDYHLRGDTWEYDGTIWRQVTPPQAPSPRCLHNMAYDPIGRQVILFGGTDDTEFRNQLPETVFDDTWAFDGSSWTRLDLADAPAGRTYHAMAYDAANGRVVLHGGISSSNIFRDTWLFDGTSWHRQEVGAPSERYGSGMVYDAGRRRIVLFGGAGPNPDEYYNDTWEWDGQQWLKRTFTKSPPQGRYGPAMTYSHILKRTVLFGGRTAERQQLGDTWEYDGEAWAQIPVSGTISARYDSQLVDFPPQRRALLFDGLNYNQNIEGDFWEYIYDSL